MTWLVKEANVFIVFNFLILSYIWFWDCVTSSCINPYRLSVVCDATPSPLPRNQRRNWKHRNVLGVMGAVLGEGDYKARKMMVCVCDLYIFRFYSIITHTYLIHHHHHDTPSNVYHYLKTQLTWCLVISYVATLYYIFLIIITFHRGVA